MARTPTLHLVAPAGEPISVRVQNLQTEARNLAREHINSLVEAIAEVERLAGEVSVGGEAYPAGVRDIARRLAVDCPVKIQTLQMIGGRS